MVRKLLVPFLLLVAILCWSPLQAQTLEGGFHTGYSVIGSETPLGTEKGVEFGVWAYLWPFPSKRWALAGDWSYVPRDAYTYNNEDSLLLGEKDRNRQYVDVTLQYYLKASGKMKVFAEVGGGALWNNSYIINPNGVTNFFPQGPQHFRKGVWTVGSGVRYQLIPHLSWVSEVKWHNPGRDQRDGVRLVTGFVAGL